MNTTTLLTYCCLATNALAAAGAKQEGFRFVGPEVEGVFVMVRLAVPGVLVMVQLMPSPVIGVRFIGNAEMLETLVPPPLLLVQVTDFA